MLKLLTYPPAFGLPSASPFGIKAIFLLHLTGREWEIKVKSDPRKTPMGKFPMLIDGETQIPDSENIRQYLEQKFDMDFDQGLSDEQRAVSRALIRMLDEHLYFAVVSDRWLNDNNWEILRGIFFDMIPGFIRGFVTGKIRAKVRSDLIAQGLARHSPEAQAQRAGQDLKAVSDILGDKPFLFGSEPSAADASAVAMISAIAAMPTETSLCLIVRENEPLMAYLERAQAYLTPA